MRDTGQVVPQRTVLEAPFQGRILVLRKLTLAELNCAGKNWSSVRTIALLRWKQPANEAANALLAGHRPSTLLGAVVPSTNWLLDIVTQAAYPLSKEDGWFRSKVLREHLHMTETRADTVFPSGLGPYLAREE